MNMFTDLVKHNPEKYPARMGQPWKREEDNKLFEELEKLMSIEDIASEHERTKGAITSRLRVLAYEMFTHEHRTKEYISEKTKMSIDQIDEAIVRRQQPMTKKERHSPDSKKIIIELLKQVQDIQKKLTELLEITN